MRAPMEDPRQFPTSADARAIALHQLAARSLAAPTSRESDACDEGLASALTAMFVPSAASDLAALFDTAPSLDVYRHLWRGLAKAERARASLRRTFAMPIVVVAATDRGEAAGTTLDGVLGDVGAIVSAMREHGALAGNASIALANTLVPADALSYPHLADLLAWGDGEHAQALPPAPIVVTGSVESVHLRYLLGTAIAAPGADLFRERQPGAWGMPAAQALSRMLGATGVSILALPRAPLPLVEAAWQGVLAQREIGAQVFASNAIRAIRARVGEPSAVISVHRSDADARSGEVRLSLSSPLDPRSAEGLRCALRPLDRVDDVVAMLTSLLADCRVSDVTRLPGVHPDRDATTGQPLLFKAGEPIH